MPSTSKSTRLYSTQSSSIGYTLTASLVENSTSISNNSSNVTLTATLSSDKIAFSYSNACTLSIYVYDNNSAPNGILVSQQNITTLNKQSSVSVSATFDSGHRSDGTLTMSAKAVLTKNTGAYTPKSGSVQTDTISLTNIPRQANITSYSVSKRSATSLTVNWNADANCDAVQYRYKISTASSYNSWTSSSGTTFNIGGLTANTTYNVQIRVKRTDSQLWTESSVATQTTNKLPTQSLNTKTETSIKMNWSSDVTASYIWYSKDNGSNWTQVTTDANATSGSYTISGLTANTSYNIKTKVRRKSNSIDEISSTTAVTTYQYPYVSAVGTSNLVIGKSQTLTLYNPLSRSCTVYMKKDSTSGTQLYSKSSVTGTSLTFTPTASTLYNSIPDATSGTAVYYCVYSSQTVSTKSGTYSIDNTSGALNPTFAASNWSYAANKTDLTNNNQVVIKGQSTVTFNINTEPTFKNNATLKNYKLEWGSKNTTITTTSGSLSSGDSNTLKVTVTDSRNYYTSTSKTLGDNYIEYFKPTMSSGTTHREDGVGTDTTLSISGTIFNAKFGNDGVQNVITSAKYYTSTDNSTWSSAYNIPTNNFRLSNNNYYLDDFQIHANGSSGGFVVGTKYYIKVTITDKIGTVTFTGITVTDGKLAIDTYQDNDGEYHRGVNGLAKDNYALTVYGDINPSDGQLIRSTGGNYIDDRDLAPVANKKAGGQGTYNPVASVKTNSGNWTIGNLGSDDILLFNYTTDSDYNSDTNNSTKYKLNPTTGLFNITSRYSYHALTNPSNLTDYYLPFIDGIENATRYTVRGNDGIKYKTREGQTSQIGQSIIELGNNMTEGTIGNKKGYLWLYDATAYTGRFQGNNNLTANRTYYLPNHNGTIQVRPTNLYNNTGAGINGTVTLSQTAANFSYIDIYFYDQGGQANHTRVASPNNKTVDLTTSTSGSTYGNVWVKTRTVKISGTSITTQWYGEGSIVGASYSKSNFIYVYRVDGWL